MLTPMRAILGRSGHHTRIVQYKYTLTSVALSSQGSEEILDAIEGKGRIIAVKATSLSTDFDLSIRDKTGASGSTNNEIFAVNAINLNYDEADMNVYYRNADTTYANKLYVVIKNDDGSNATGPIALELFVETMDKE